MTDLSLREILAIIGLAIVAFIACTWVWLLKRERDDPHWGSEEDEGFEMVDFEAEKGQP